MNNKLNAYVRFDGTGKIVPSSVILQRSKPKVGNWKEIDANECCNYTTTTTTTLPPSTTTTTTGIITTVYPYTYDMYSCDDCVTVLSSGSLNNSVTIFDDKWYPWTDPAFKIYVTSVTPGYNTGYANTYLYPLDAKNTCGEITCP